VHFGFTSNNVANAILSSNQPTKTSKHTCSDSLNLKPPATPYPLQDF